MEEGFGSKGTNVPHHDQVHSFVNVADDDTTEVVDFAYDDLQQYHKASPTPQPLCVTEQLCSVVEGNINTNNYDNIDVSMFSSNARNYCYYLFDAIPKPEPTWSTTVSPCVLAEPTPIMLPSSSSSQPPQIEGSLGVLEFREKNQQEGSSYSWWMGFLDGLDCNIMNNEEILLDHPFVENNVAMENYSMGNNCYESQFVDAMDLSSCFCPDEWLMVPTMEKDFGEIVMP